MEKVSNKAIGRTWEEVENEIYTPEEIAESDKRVAQMLGKLKLKSAMIDAAILHSEKTIANDHDEVEILDDLDRLLYKAFEGLKLGTSYHYASGLSFRKF
jgi:hypothetical protein